MSTTMQTRHGLIVRAFMVLVVMLSCAGVLFTSAAPANAASYQITNTGGVGVRQRHNPTVNSTYSGVAPEGVTVNLECQQWGDATGWSCRCRSRSAR